jgi:glyoxalase family protein
VTFFEWPAAARGKPGIGGTHHFALTVAGDDGLLKWKRRLSDLGIPVTGPLDRAYFRSLYFQDPDGTNLEIATLGPGWTVDEPAGELGQELRRPPQELVVRNRDEARIQSETWPEPVPEIDAGMALLHGMHHITAISSDIQRTHAFYADVLGMQRVKMTWNFDDPDSAHWYWGADGGRPGTLLTYFERSRDRESRARMGAGQTHHFALSVADEETQLAWRERLLRHGYRVSPVMDRVYFRSIYSHDPDGHIVELATAGPGFTVDEDAAHLGQALRLPPWYEERRAQIEAGLKPLTIPAWSNPEGS